MNNTQGTRQKKCNSRKTIFASGEGIALLMVLWVLMVLMVVVLSFSFMARTETLSSRSFKEGIEKKFLAEAGLQRAIVEIYYRAQNLALDSADLWKTNGTPHLDSLGKGSYTVRITDESGKLDLNMLNDRSGIILKNLLISSGVKDEDANTIVDSTLDWKDKNIGMHRLSGAGDDYYLSLPNPYKVKHADFDTVEELLMIKGMKPEILYGNAGTRGIIDFLTVYSRSSGVNANAAPKEILTAVPGITPEIADTIIDYRENKKITSPQEVGIPAESFPYVTFVDINTFTIEAVGHKGDEAKGYAVKATITLEADNKYKFLYYKSPANVTQ